MAEKIKKPVTKGVAKVPVVMQLEALECGAASLCMILAYYNKWIPLEQVREDCGVSRDGSNARNVLKAARFYGLEAKGYRYEPETLKTQGKFPCIIHWNFNHFVVLDGFRGGKAYLNDPAKGTYSVPMDTFDDSFTGICLQFEPTDAFTPSGKPKSMLSFAAKRLKGTGAAMAFTVLTGIVAALMGLVQPAFSRVFLDHLLTGKDLAWTTGFLLFLGAFNLIQIIMSALQAVYSLRINGKMAAVGKADFEDAIDSIANAVMGTRLRDALSQNEIAGSAIEEILKFYHCKSKTEELPPQIRTVDEQIEYRMRPFGIKSRSVTLERGWYNHAVGAMLGTMKEDGSAVALIPGKLAGYRLINFKTGKQIKLNRKTEGLLDKEAVCFYEPLPQKALTMADLLKFMVQQLSVSDIVLYLLLMGLSAALGLLSPLFTRWLFGDVLQSGSIQVLLSLAVFMVCFSISQLCFNAFQGLVNSRIGIKQNIAVQAAVMNRIMSLPATFFKKYASGELSQRAAYVQSLCSILWSTIGMTGLTSLFSLIYIGQIFAFAPSLVVPSLIITAATIGLSLLTTFAQMKITREKMDISAKTSGLTYATITGIQKIKLAGAEKRMFSRWARQYAKEAQLEYNPPVFLKLSGTISLVLSLAGTMILYATAIKSGISVADYYAFNTAYGMVSSAFMSVASIAITVANIRPTLEMAKPIMEAEPETHDGKEIITSLQGNIELSHVFFRYDESMPNVIDDLSLTIKAGEYLAIVGSTGCGKSTLMRLLLGFETPQKGSIFFDKKDIARIDLESLRSKIGTVMQDGKLFLGDIYSNIVITAPELTILFIYFIPSPTGYDVIKYIEWEISQGNLGYMYNGVYYSTPYDDPEYDDTWCF